MHNIPAAALAAVPAAFAYGITAAALGDRPNAPVWLRWPLAVWNFIASSWRQPAPSPPRPDYARINQLERELGLIDERPLRSHRTVCLTKNCAGSTQELRTWSGQLIRHIHHCEPGTTA
ncbi:hypothetical protein [Streptomyces griseosporeus]|uniref:hypothetical protein n=1 Tax=Streptomyces griseosporeus TaxID=1910 RepID=UPI0036F60812